MNLELPGMDGLLGSLPPAAREAIVRQGVKILAEFHCFSGREILRWQGIDPADLEVINLVLREEGWPEKLLPTSPIFGKGVRDS